MLLAAVPVPNVLPVVAAAAIVATVLSVALSSSLTSPSNTWYMLLVGTGYPNPAAMFGNSIELRRRVYTSWMNVFRAGYVLT